MGWGGNTEYTQKRELLSHCGEAWAVVKKKRNRNAWASVVKSLGERGRSGGGSDVLRHQGARGVYQPH